MSPSDELLSVLYSTFLHHKRFLVKHNLKRAFGYTRIGVWSRKRTQLPSRLARSGGKRDEMSAPAAAGIRTSGGTSRRSRRAEALSPEEQSRIGQKAGTVGGKARAEKLTAKRRSEIARKAAAARWANKKKDD